MTSSNPPEPELPDEIGRWPADNRELFGLGAAATRRDLKRAYTKLIRRFKPEHSPEQFRRLRDAFESLDQQFEWREVFESRHAIAHKADDDSHPDRSRQMDSINAAKPESSDDHRTAPQHSSNPIDAQSVDAPADADQIWQDALDGAELRETYTRLVSLSSQQPVSETTFARLFWLLTIHPEFDLNRDPIVWLIDGIQRLGAAADNRLSRILSIDVRRRSGLVPNLLVANLFHESNSIRQIVQLAESRWFVARQLKQFSVIKDDLTSFGKLFLFDPEGWQRLLSIALRNLVLVQNEMARETLTIVRDELIGSTSGPESHHLWDWCEITLNLHDTWLVGVQQTQPKDLATVRITNLSGRSDVRRNSQVEATRRTFVRLLGLIERTWELSSFAIAADLRSFCDLLVNRSSDPLTQLAAITQVARPVMIRLLDLLREYQSELNEGAGFEMTEATQSELDRFVRDELWRDNYWHPKVLGFCLREAVTPNDIGMAIERIHEQLPDISLNLAQSIRNELSIACLVEAQRLLW